MLTKEAYNQGYICNKAYNRLKSEVNPKKPAAKKHPDNLNQQAHNSPNMPEKLLHDCSS
jgi:hypothetical protein